MTVTTRLTSPSVPRICVGCSVQVDEPAAVFGFHEEIHWPAGPTQMTDQVTGHTAFGSSVTTRTRTYSYVKRDFRVSLPLCGTCGPIEKQIWEWKDRAHTPITRLGATLGGIATICLLALVRFHPTEFGGLLVDYLVLPAAVFFLVWFVAVGLANDVSRFLYIRFVVKDAKRSGALCRIGYAKDHATGCATQDKLTYEFRNMEFGEEFKKHNSAILNTPDTSRGGTLLTGRFGAA